MYGLVDPRRPEARCVECAKELTRAERHAAHEQDLRCDACWLGAHAEPTTMLSPEAAAQSIGTRVALRAARARLPLPPRVPSRVWNPERVTARPGAP